MSWMQINHETTYRYKTKVRFGPHRLVLRPREGHDVRVEDMRLEVSPEFELEWSRDVFGNSVATVHFLSTADHLRIHSHVLIRQSAPFPLREIRTPGRVPYPVTYSEYETAVAGAYLATTFPEDADRVSEWAKASLDHAETSDATEILALVGQTIRREIKYRRREEKGVQSPARTLELGSGSCRDLATLMLEVLRTVGLPARFASGYLDCAASEAGRASMHAWAEAYLPEIGWTGYDPTVGERTSDKHVVTGVSNHPRGVMPVSGTFFDDQKAYLGMSVTVQTHRFSERPRGC